jgi:putative transposase
MAKRKRHSSMEIATKLAQANDLAMQGKLQSEIARALGVSVMTLHRWRTREASEPDWTRAGATELPNSSSKIHSCGDC